MSPMQELDVLKGLQASICGLDLDAPQDVYGLWPVERALALGAAMEASAGRIIAAQCPVTQAWAVICAKPVDDLIEGFKANLAKAQQKDAVSRAAQTLADEVTENWKARAEVVRQRRDAIEAERIDNSRVHPGFAPILATLDPLGPLTQSFADRGKHV